MSQLYAAYTTQGSTANGGLTNTTSLNKCVDLFFMAGSSRGKDITSEIAQALAEDKEKALRILQWMRDVRGGAGERQLFRNALNYLYKTDREAFTKLLSKVPEIGRWDDYLALEDKEARHQAYVFIQQALEEGNGLCAKWMPRKGNISVELTKFLGLSPRSYRKTLVGMTNVVEQLMCGKQWNEIDFSKIPSLAAARYQKAFMRNCEKHYQSYLDKLTKGEAKINAGAVYPYDVTKSLHTGNIQAANAQWEALPNYLEGNDQRILPVVDVSGSMACPAGGSSVSCMEVAISLGLYLSERSQGVLKDVFMTFSEQPEMCKLSGTLQQRYAGLRSAKWGMSTNIARVFECLLQVAKQYNVPSSEMPTTIIILSDMEFNNCIRDGQQVTAYDHARMVYSHAGYELPQIVFWNLNARPGNNPVRYDTSGTAMISGFSPAIVKNVLGGKDMTPEKVMLDTIMVDRYNI